MAGSIEALARLAGSPSWALRSRRVLVGNGGGRATLSPAIVLIDGARIGAVIAGDALPAELPVPVCDLGDRVIAPGLVDSHVHVNEPGRTDWEGFATATRAAAAGGVTTLVDMPLNCIPVTTRRAALEEKLRAVSGKLHVDVGFWGGVVPGNAGELAGLAEAGALGCKAFLVHSGIDEFPNASEAELRAAMPALRAAGLPLLAHAELDLGRPRGRRRPARVRGLPALAAGRLGGRGHRAADPARARHGMRRARRPPLVGRVARPDRAGPRTRGCRSPPRPARTTSASRRRRSPTGPPSSSARRRSASTRTARRCGRGCARGSSTLVVTDHSPCTPALKARERGDFAEAWGGIASLQLGLPAVWSEARRRGHDLADLATWMSARPAALAGLGRRKGRIAPGFDADLVVWDPEAEVSVAADRLFFRHKVSPYLGRRLWGRVEATLLRGQLVYDGEAHPAGPVGVPLLGRDTLP